MSQNETRKLVTIQLLVDAPTSKNPQSEAVADHILSFIPDTDELAEILDAAKLVMLPASFRAGTVGNPIVLTVEDIAAPDTHAWNGGLTEGR